MAGLVLLPAGLFMLLTMPLAGALTVPMQPKCRLCAGMLSLAQATWWTAAPST